MDYNAAQQGLKTEIRKYLVAQKISLKIVEELFGLIKRDACNRTQIAIANSKLLPKIHHPSVQVWTKQLRVIEKREAARKAEKRT